MRPIKFRAWDKELKLMAPVHIWDFTEPFNDRFIPMQFTGLKDKNGKKIYEGDIVNVTERDNPMHWLGKVEWNIRGYWLIQSTTQDNWYSNIWEVDQACEVIGNIWENPELLGDK